MFLLCAPSDHQDDVPITIRSRCRVVPLRTPAPDAIAEVLVEPRRDRPGHRAAGRRRCPAATSAGPGTWPATRRPGPHRETVLGLPLRMRGLGDAFAFAGDLVRTAKDEAATLSESRDLAEREELAVAMGAGGTGKGVAAAARGAKAAERELERRQKSRNTRTQRDAIDRALVDLAGFFRDALVVGSGAAGAADQPRPGGRRPPGRHRVDRGVGAAPAGGGAGLPHRAGRRTSSRRSPSRR